MIIAKLIEYAHHAKDADGDDLLSDPAFAKKPVDYLLVIDASGRFIGADKTQGKGERKQGKEYLIPVYESPGNTAVSVPLVGTVPYVLGPGPWSKPGQTENHNRLHDLFLEAVRQGAETDSRVCAVSKFYDGPLPDLSNLKLKEGTRLAFVLEGQRGELMCQWESIRCLWKEAYAQQATKRRGAGVPCIACGRVRPAAVTHGFISGIPVPPGAMKRSKLVSCDKPAYCSHGLEQSMNAPTCEECATAYVVAVNRLLKNTQTHYCDRDAMIAYAFWSLETTHFDLNATAIEASEEHIAGLYRSPRTPRHMDALAQDECDRFYVLALSASGARVIIRDWIETHLSTLYAALRAWFDDLKIVSDRPWPAKNNAMVKRGEVFCRFPMKFLVRSLARKKDKGWDIPIRSASVLFRAAIADQVLPEDLLSAAMARVQVEHDIPPPRAALIKLILNRRIRQRNQGEQEMPESLDASRSDPAYVCGRLLGVLEKVQRAALGDIGATIIDRYFGAASTAPRTVFPTLIHKATTHLGKLRGEKPGLARSLQRAIEETIARIGDSTNWIGQLPAMLDLEARGRFAIGFYHERAKPWGKNKIETTELSNQA